MATRRTIQCFTAAVLAHVGSAWQIGPVQLPRRLASRAHGARASEESAGVFDAADLSAAKPLGFGNPDSPPRGFGSPDSSPRGFGSPDPSFRGFGSPPDSTPRGFGAWQEDEEAKAEPAAPKMTEEERRLWKRKVMQRWSKVIQEKGGSLDSEAGEELARLSNVTVRFGERLVLSPQSWGVRCGQRIGVLGESGCGKSLQLRLLAGQAVPTSGEVLPLRACPPTHPSTYLLKDALCAQVTFVRVS